MNDRERIDQILEIFADEPKFKEYCLNDDGEYRYGYLPDDVQWKILSHEIYDIIKNDYKSNNIPSSINRFKVDDGKKLDMSGLKINFILMHGADFRNINMDGIDFSNSILHDNDFRDVSMVNANLSSIQFNESDFRGADLTGANLKLANLSEVKVGGNTILPFNEQLLFSWPGKLNVAEDYGVRFAMNDGRIVSNLALENVGDGSVRLVERQNYFSKDLADEFSKADSERGVISVSDAIKSVVGGADRSVVLSNINDIMLKGYRPDKDRIFSELKVA